MGERSPSETADSKDPFEWVEEKVLAWMPSLGLVLPVGVRRLSELPDWLSPRIGVECFGVREVDDDEAIGGR